MTGQNLLTIIMLLFFIIPLLLHYHKLTNLFDTDYGHEIICTILFVFSIIYLLATLGIFIKEHWNTPIF